MKPLDISDGVIRLRTYRPEDVDGLVAAVSASRRELERWMWWCHPAWGIAEAHPWVANAAAAWSDDRSYEAVIEDPATGTFVGGCGLNQLDPIFRGANLGYWISTPRAGHGLATRAARMMATWGLTEAGLQRVSIIASVHNLASQRVAAKIGAQREGIRRNQLRFSDAPEDAVGFGLIPGDLNP